MQNAVQPEAPLAGLGVLVTRPTHQAEGLCCLLQAQGADAIRFPVLDILEPRRPEAALVLIERLADYEMAVFTSANAVERAVPLIRARGGPPASLLRIAIGKATARALQRLNMPAQLVPESPFNSEALLDMPQMQALAGCKIVILRGEGGRELLVDTLRRRGALVDCAEVYRRARPQVDPGELIGRWMRGEIQAVVVTSNEALQNLFDMMGEHGRRCLGETPLVVVSQRALELARRLGIGNSSMVAGEASDEAIVETLLKWYQSG